MSILLILNYLIAVAMIVHVFKTGRNTMWIWVLLMAPGVGFVAYLIVEILPGILGSRGLQSFRRGVKQTLDPGAQLRRYEQEARVTANVASSQRYAEELTRQGQFEPAIGVYRRILTGLYEHDPDLMLGLARAQFGLGDAAAARATLEALVAANPQFRSPECRLLYARALEASGSIEQALAAYHDLAGAYPGAEAAVRYAQLLKSQGRGPEAAQVARDLLEQARIAPAHYRRAQREWLDSAARLVSG